MLKGRGKKFQRMTLISEPWTRVSGVIAGIVNVLDVRWNAQLSNLELDWPQGTDCRRLTSPSPDLHNSFLIIKYIRSLESLGEDSYFAISSCSLHFFHGYQFIHHIFFSLYTFQSEPFGGRAREGERKGVRWLATRPGRDDFQLSHSCLSFIFPWNERKL